MFFGDFSISFAVLLIKRLRQSSFYF